MARRKKGYMMRRAQEVNRILSGYTIRLEAGTGNVIKPKLIKRRRK